MALVWTLFLSSPAAFFLPSVLSWVVLFSRGPLWCFGSHSMSHSLPYLQVWLFSPAWFCFFNPCTDNALHYQLTAVLVTPGTLGVPLPLKLWFLTVYPAPVPCLRSQTNIQIHLEGTTCFLIYSFSVEGRLLHNTVLASTIYQFKPALWKCILSRKSSC